MKAVKWGINMSKEKADKIREDIAKLSDDDLLNFQASTHAGEYVAPKHFESAGEYMKRRAELFNAFIPF